MRLRTTTAALLATATLAGCSDTTPSGDASAAADAAGNATPAVTIENPGRPAISIDGSNPIVVAANGAHRSAENIARNAYRHPVATLEFFGLDSTDTVVELWPGGGAWYTEVLAPVLRDNGLLIAANYPADSASDYRRGAGEKFREKMAGNPAIYGKVQEVGFEPPAMTSFGPSNSADLVLIPRTYHNMIGGETVDPVLKAAFDVLKPGGTLGIVQHRANETDEPEAVKRDGYVKESVVKADAARHGFEFAGSSEINANPFDTKDHPAGVWSMPPVMAGCRDMEGKELEDCRARWGGMGESDRMTLKFTKPAAAAG